MSPPRRRGSSFLYCIIFKNMKNITMDNNFKPEEKLQEIIQAYNQVMQETDGSSFYDVKILPYSKDEIFKALLAAIKLSDNPQIKEHLKAGLISLSYFQENIGDFPIKPFGKDPQEWLTMPDKKMKQSLKDTEWQTSFEKYKELHDKSDKEIALYMNIADKLDKPHLPHRKFIDQWKNGEIKIDVDRSKALRIANSNSFPKRYRAAHVFWSTVWLLTIPLGIWLFFYKWWVGLLVLFIASPLIAKATKTSAMQFMINHALESESFYNHATTNGVFRTSKKPSTIPAPLR